MKVNICNSGGIWSQPFLCIWTKGFFYKITALSQGGICDYPSPVVTTDTLKPPIVCTIHNYIGGFVPYCLLGWELMPLLILFQWMTHSSKAQRSCYQPLPISAFLQHLRNQTYKEDIKDLSNTWINKSHWITRIYRQPFNKSGSIKTKKYHNDPRLSTIREYRWWNMSNDCIEICVQKTHGRLERQRQVVPLPPPSRPTLLLFSLRGYMMNVHDPWN